MKKNQRGEITTILTVASLVVIGVTSLVSSFFLTRQKQTIKSKAEIPNPANYKCAKIKNVYSDPPSLTAGQDFTCYATIDGDPNSGNWDKRWTYNIACGWSKDGEWPLNGGRWENARCIGPNCSFGIRAPAQVNPGSNYTLVAFDMTRQQEPPDKGGCGPTTGMSVKLNIQESGQSNNKNEPTQIPNSTPTSITSSDQTTNTPTPTLTNTPIPIRVNTPTPTLTNTPIPIRVNTPTPTSTPTNNPTPTPPLLSESGVLANPGMLIIENINNEHTLRLIVISLQGRFIFSSYEYVYEILSPRQSFTYKYDDKCTWYRKQLTGYLAYYSSEDDYKFARFKRLDLSCDHYLVLGIN